MNPGSVPNYAPGYIWAEVLATGWQQAGNNEKALPGGTEKGCQTI